MKILKLLFVVSLLVSCNSNKKNEEVSQKVEDVNTTVSVSTDLEVYDFDGFEKYLTKNDGKTYVVNFWATWCAPCVKELPYFEKLNQEYKNKNVEVLLVSLDFPHLYDTKLKPFIAENKLQSKVVALNDVDMNTWIPKVNEDWSGSIPATVIYRNDESKFYEQSFTYESLENELKQFVK
ncbi:TlpA family protein disulfide reductase [Flavobacteriaceae bacterium XHP0103]|uniref:TlpA disulfide reductase family protein n=1 Tax=Marixanthotalea marina TaxID=2844359 RepID=UPI002989BB89|nr:TlpA disulfide reductase family protein [Marixanthotalea marina]MBU3821148.1 TlpA family protein disulfide reductase [Marixanthotalea marina]